jgi:hypothetical protein
MNSIDKAYRQQNHNVNYDLMSLYFVNYKPQIYQNMFQVKITLNVQTKQRMMLHLNEFEHGPRDWLFQLKCFVFLSVPRKKKMLE